MTDNTRQPHLWARTQITLESIAASRRVLAKSEATLRRARAAVNRADALLKRIHSLCVRSPLPEYGPAPRLSIRVAPRIPPGPRIADEDTEFSLARRR